MKRRSARPFMVEVKGARTARASLTAPDLRARPENSLWQELAQVEVKPPQPDVPAASAPRPERKEPETPVRRVLPSLVPMFEIPAETESEPDAAAPPVRRARRGRPPAVAPKPDAPNPARSIRPCGPAVTAPVAAKPATKPRRPAAERSEPAAAPAVPVPPAEPGQGPSARPGTWRRTKELRLGERWKRRLPHFAR